MRSAKIVQIVLLQILLISWGWPAVGQAYRDEAKIAEAKGNVVANSTPEYISDHMLLEKTPDKTIYNVSTRRLDLDTDLGSGANEKIWARIDLTTKRVRYFYDVPDVYLGQTEVNWRRANTFAILTRNDIKYYYKDAIDSGDLVPFLLNRILRKQCPLNSQMYRKTNYVTCYIYRLEIPAELIEKIAAYYPKDPYHYYIFTSTSGVFERDKYQVNYEIFPSEASGILLGVKKFFDRGAAAFTKKLIEPQNPGCCDMSETVEVAG